MCTTGSLLEMVQRAEPAGAPPVSRASYTSYPSHSLLSIEIGDRKGAGETETVAFGHLDLELTEDGRLCAIECALPPERWHEAPDRVPSPAARGLAAPLIGAFKEVVLDEPLEVMYCRPTERGVMGATVTGPLEPGRLLRLATGVLVELTSDDRVTAVWMEDVMLRTTL